MAKDPAFLFYSSDFTVATQFMTDEQVGKYIRLLIAQHQHGHLSEKIVNIICKSYDFDIMQKFKKDADGNFYNERLEEEINKRKAYSESRGKNKKGKIKQSEQENKDFKKKNISKSYDFHMENENINENINNINKGVVEKKSKKKNVFTPPTLQEMQSYFADNGYSVNVAMRAWNGYQAADWHDSTGKPVLNWKQKCQNVWFKDENKVTNNGNSNYRENTLNQLDAVFAAKYGN